MLKDVSVLLTGCYFLYPEKTKKDGRDGVKCDSPLPELALCQSSAVEVGARTQAHYDRRSEV